MRNIKLYTPVTCPDGLTVSIQASEVHYCTPRDNTGPYTSVELGFPNQIPPKEILEYADDKDSPTDTVYGYVPVDLVKEWIESHGGKLPDGIL